MSTQRGRPDDPAARRPARRARRRPELLLALLAPLFWGGSCTVSAFHCSEDCDPCVSTCKCADNQHCDQPLSIADEGALRLEHYAYAAVADAGSVSETFGAILGLSIARVLPGRDHERSDLVRFADGVLRVNAPLLGDPRVWELGSVERFSDATIVVYAAPSASIAFLFDRAGNLLEIVRESAAPRAR